MNDYAQHVLDSFSYMLDQKTKMNASLTISHYMNTMLRRAKTDEDIQVFVNTLDECKKFAEDNQLGGLLRTCTEWEQLGLKKLDEIHGIVHEDNPQSNENNYNSDVFLYVQSVLKRTSEMINKVGRIDTNDFQIASDKLDELEAGLIASGGQYLNDEQISNFKNEILKQREQIEDNYAMIDEILESSHMSR